MWHLELWKRLDKLIKISDYCMYEKLNNTNNKFATQLLLTKFLHKVKFLGSSEDSEHAY